MFVGGGNLTGRRIADGVWLIIRPIRRVLARIQCPRRLCGWLVLNHMLCHHALHVLPLRWCSAWPRKASKSVVVLEADGLVHADTDLLPLGASRSSPQIAREPYVHRHQNFVRHDGRDRSGFTFTSEIEGPFP